MRTGLSCSFRVGCFCPSPNAHAGCARGTNRLLLLPCGFFSQQLLGLDWGGGEKKKKKKESTYLSPREGKEYTCDAARYVAEMISAAR